MYQETLHLLATPCLSLRNTPVLGLRCGECLGVIEAELSEMDVGIDEARTSPGIDQQVPKPFSTVNHCLLVPCSRPP